MQTPSELNEIKSEYDKSLKWIDQPQRKHIKFDEYLRFEAVQINNREARIDIHCLDSVYRVIRSFWHLLTQEGQFVSEKNRVVSNCESHVTIASGLICLTPDDLGLLDIEFFIETPIVLNIIRS